MRQIKPLLSFILALACGTAQAGGVPTTPMARSCASLADLALQDAEILEAVEIPPTENTPAWCKVTAVVKRFATDDPLTVWVGLPLNGWNGRFMGTGGSGYTGGTPARLADSVADGFAAAATDTGPRTVLTGRDVADGELALDDKGRLNWRSIRNFSHRGIHVMTQTGKAIVTAFYGKPAGYSYFSGCSTGGRQAMAEAQRYPEDYDGLLAASPAIYAARYIPGRLWGQLNMLLADNFMPKCKFEAATAAAIQACDTIDGVEDEIIGNPRLCNYDPRQLVGIDLPGCGRFTAADADIVGKSWDGPKRRDGSFMWYGFARGAQLETLNSTERNDAGQWHPSGNWAKYYLSWHRYLLAQDPALPFDSFTRQLFEDYWDQSVEQYTDVYSAEDPNLDRFMEHGGKVLMWQGETDPTIPPQGAIHYYEQVKAHFGSAAAAGKVFRLFMAPGVNHCHGGKGPAPAAMVDALIEWVEDEQAPTRLLAVSEDRETGAITRTRPLCSYPRVARYRGTGSTDKAENFACADSY